MQKRQFNVKRTVPIIMSILGSIGLIGTAIMSAKNTPKAILVLKQAEEKKGEKLNTIEIIKIAGPIYIPTVLLGVSTIMCIVGTNIVNKRNQASIAGAYALLNQTYQKYRESAKTIFGEDADEKIIAQVAKDVYVSSDGYYIYTPDKNQEESELILFYDSFSQRYFKATMMSVLNAQYHINRNFILRGSTSINEFYEFIGIEKIEEGDDILWYVEELDDSGFTWIDFNNTYTELDDGLECYILSFVISPEHRYDHSF